MGVNLFVLFKNPFLFYFQLTRENKDLKERCTTLEEELRICNKQLDRGNTSIQRLERDLDEVKLCSLFNIFHL